MKELMRRAFIEKADIGHTLPKQSCVEIGNYLMLICLPGGMKSQTVMDLG